MTAPGSFVPRGFAVRQAIVGPRLDDVAGDVERRLALLDLGQQVRSGDTVAIAAGSRGIANLAVVLRVIVDHLRALGAEPFIVPAMGSHGGATAEGQAQILRSYGVTDDAVGCAVRASMEVTEIGRSTLGFPIVTDALAFGADHLVVCNRVKPHTLFTGPIESGLTKMLMIGLGKQVGAANYHRAIADLGWTTVVDEVAPILLDRHHLLAGVAILERSDDQTAQVEVLAPDQILGTEPQLLARARAWMPRLPFPAADLVLIDRIGKDISGAGLDVNVVGRKDAPHEGHHGPGPHVRYVAIRGLTPATHRNAVGLGLAELCRTRIVREMDVATTRLNALTALDLPAAMVPLDYETDREILDVALDLIGLRAPQEGRILWIPDTLHLQNVWCSEAYLADATGRDDLEILSEPAALPFDPHGNLPDDIPAVWT